MGRLAKFIAIATVVAILGGCQVPGRPAHAELLALAGRVPAEAESVFFWDLKPGEATRARWEAFRAGFQTSAEGRRLLAEELYNFEPNQYGLEPLVAGPALRATWQEKAARQQTTLGELARSWPITLVMIQVTDGAAARAAALEALKGTTSGRQEVKGRTVYVGVEENQHVSWTIDGDLFIHVASGDGDPIPIIERLLDLDPAASVAALPAWQILRSRLPGAPLGLLFTQQEPRRGLSLIDRPSLTSLFSFTRAFAAAVVPDEGGLAVHFSGLLDQSVDTVPGLSAVLGQGPIDPSSWLHLPANSALVVMGSNVPKVWPILQATFNVNLLRAIAGTARLQIAPDLATPGGPLAGEFALAITPPLANQAADHSLAAVQVLLAARGATRAQMDQVQAAMQGRGTGFGTSRTNGVSLWTATGAHTAGYDVSYRFDGDTLLLGSSPEIIDQGVMAARVREGLTRTKAFRQVSATWPDGATLALYLDFGQSAAVNRANATGIHGAAPVFPELGAAQALGLGLRLKPDRIDGVLYLLMNEK